MRPRTNSTTRSGELRNDKPRNSTYLSEAAYPTNHPEIAATLANIGTSQQRLGDYEASLDTLNRALTINEAAHRTNHPNIAITLTNIALTLEGLGRIDEAIAAVERSVTIFEHALGPNHPTTRQALEHRERLTTS